MSPPSIEDFPGGEGTQWEPRGGIPFEIADFQPKPLVAWFAPGQLVRTAFRTLFAEVIASYVDRRETQAALPPLLDPPTDLVPPPLSRFRGLVDADYTEREGGPQLKDLSEREGCKEVWIDYIADFGDGWDPAYTMSLLLAQQKLRVHGLHDDSLLTAKLDDAEVTLAEDELPRADFLVLGGDQVYPTPSRDDYTDRLRAPLVCAFPPVSRDDLGQELPSHRDAAPLLFAVPGNHDWYDGLTDYLRVFCQGANIGRWRTRQRRSYFSVRLPFGWWLWGIDIQLDTRIDPVQLDHFRRLVRTSDGPADDPKRVILCTSQPSWVYGTTGLEANYKNLMYFEAQVTAAAERGRIPPVDGGDPKIPAPEIPVTLAGDLHHYARYEEHAEDHPSGKPPRQRIHCGGGGSYLRGTFSLPRVLPRPNRPGRKEGSKGELIETGTPYPSRSESKRLAYGALRLPLLRHNRSFCLFLGVLYALLVAGLEVAEYPLGTRERGLDMEHLRDYLASLRPSRDSLGDYAEWIAGRLLEAPLGVLMLSAVLFLGVGFATLFNRTARHRRVAGLWGLLHGAAHVALALLVGWGVADVLRGGVRIEERWYEAVLYPLTALVSAPLAGFLVGVYLVASALLLRLHDNEVFSVQSIPDFRSFLRIRIDTNGDLTIYPLGVRRVPRRWRRWSQRKRGDPYFEPADAVVPQPHLIEAPIVVRRPRKEPAPAPAGKGGERGRSEDVVPAARAGAPG